MRATGARAMKNTNNSSTGGYLPQAPLASLPGSLTLQEFLQTVLVGISGLPGELVRPKWQIDPPKQPDIYIDWIAFGLSEDESDTFAYDSVNSSGANVFQRMDALTLNCSFYGPNGFSIAQSTRDGFQIGQNREALQSAKMDFVSTGKMTRAPDIVNERWVDRWEMAISLRAEILRSYSILNLVSMNGTLYTQGSTMNAIALNVEE
jgi:hypothetical protein